MPQQIIKFVTDGLSPVYIDLNQVSNIASVEITSIAGVQNRVQVMFKGGGTIFLNHTFVKDLTAYMDAWMAHVNSKV
jgi:hypothetical protein